MQDVHEYFKGKKITVMGLGLLGRGVGDTAFLAECGAELIVTDKKSKEELQESLDRLSGFQNITYILGEHREEDFSGRDMILKAAGVPQNSPYLEIARRDGAEIAMSASLFAKLSGIPIIGITGTRGKSTVTHMIHHVLSQVTEGAPVLLGGNVRGVSNLQLLKDVHEDSVAVMELDSWQLQGFGEYGISPHVAVFTNFMEDHMNYYLKGNPSTTATPSEAEYRAGMDAYFGDKAHIFLHQEESGVLVTTEEVFSRAREYARGKHITLGQEIRLVDTSILPDDCLLAMPGEHNRLNAALATEALRAVGLTDEEIFAGLATFPGVPGRLEYLGEKDGIKIYNDNNATTPQATIEGIRAVAGPSAPRRNIILVAGGSDKDIDLSTLVPVMNEYCKKVCLIPGTGTERLAKLTGAMVFHTLEEAVEAALDASASGDVLLFSPAFASFGTFRNEYDRNDQFVDIIRRVL